MLKIDFYFWGDQCPHNFLIKNQLEELLHKDHYAIEFIDISKDFKIAEELKIYSPNLIIFDHEFRWNGPITMETIKKFEQGEKPKQRPYTVKAAHHLIEGDLKPLTEETLPDSHKPCAPSHGKNCCFPKSQWIKKIKDQYQLDCLGYLHYKDGECVGGAEFVPSLIVPYKIPRDEHSAFLTCVFVSDENEDYKSYPLEQLEKALPEMGFNVIYTVASEDVVFPNGPLDWFIRRGYRDLGIINDETDDYAKMHLLKKEL